MSITKRRKQFLEEIVKIYQDTLLPVHYETIANAIGVSKWTAYDVMQVLEKEGYLERTYKKNSNDTGRSIVVFSPTQEVIKLFTDVNKQISTTEEVREIKGRVIDFIVALENKSYTESVNQMLLKMEKVEFCYYFLGILVFHLNQLGKETRSLIKFVITISNKPYVQLSVFVGLVVGMTTLNSRDELGLNIFEISHQFFDYLDELNSNDLNRLIDFLKEI
ncbi:LexA family transcriptional regulator [Bacillus sp. V2I10]|uniref:LexA family protein n=1 Tax=Bacillus sp. V2I10 TaxID=3042276 RepID=UPI00278B4F1A|nr:Lrp/AsnC family transcriptional regulator [Bacillus sp. V2I10]MDQ0859090.1 DNA-binding Lrp family transcriptional regulator [Bacillus sp. V2I10]